MYDKPPQGLKPQKKYGIEAKVLHNMTTNIPLPLIKVL